MSAFELSLVGLLNDDQGNERPEAVAADRPTFTDPALASATPAVRQSEYRSVEGLGGGGIKEFPYVDLIRDHLAHGRILEARKLFEFARGFIPMDSRLSTALAPPKIKKSSRRSVDRSAEYRWLDENSAKFRGKWVALAAGRLMASCDTLKGLLASLDASACGISPLIHHLD